MIVTNEKCELIPFSRFSINFYPTELTSSFLRLMLIRRERENKRFNNLIQGEILHAIFREMVLKSNKFSFPNLYEDMLSRIINHFKFLRIFQAFSCLFFCQIKNKTLERRILIRGKSLIKFHVKRKPPQRCFFVQLNKSPQNSFQF